MSRRRGGYTTPLLLPVVRTRLSNLALLLAASLPLLMISCTKSGHKSEPIAYPKTDTVDSASTYGSVVIKDPFRWLENDTSEATKAWVKAQNQVTFGYLDKIPYRGKLKAELEKNFNNARYGVPEQVGDFLIYERNEGQQNQSVFYIQQGETGKPEVLLDPNKWSKDGTTSFSLIGQSRDHNRLIFSERKAGSDWCVIKTMDLRLKSFLPDSISWVKFSGAATNDKGFYYSAYEKPKSGSGLSELNSDNKIYFHKYDTPQSADVLVYQDPANPLRYNSLAVSDDQQYEYLYISTGTYGNEIRVRKAGDLKAPFTTLCKGFDNQFGIIGNTGSTHYILTDYKAPNQRIVAVDVAKPAPENWKDVIAEGKEAIESASFVGTHFFVNRIVDVCSQVMEYNEKGELVGEVMMPDLGSVDGFYAKPSAKKIYYAFTSYLYPRTVLSYDLESKASNVLFEPKIAGFDPSDFESKRVFVNSKDGTKVPLFITYKKGLKLDGSNPTLLYGYGGFNVAIQPRFSSIDFTRMKLGMVIANASMRGGNEYGEAWHKGGMLLNKQNVFDDFIACANYLKQEKYTSKERLAINGRSNGGLLVGAVMTQQPDLCQVAIPEVGVLDMLRYHKFTVGWGWMVEYGNPDEPQYFDYIRKYSPLHNLKKGTSYPATLITTADHDDRVVPAHSFKFAAELQRCHKGDNPVLIRIDTQAGHGGSSLTKAIELETDRLSFMLYNMNYEPVFE